MAHTEHRFEADLTWTGAAHGPTHAYRDYSREYEVRIEGKPPMRGSAAPAFLGDASLQNPEDLLLAALSACHCLSYLAECARAGIPVVAYSDRATGIMRFHQGAMRFAHATLRPEVRVEAGADLDRALKLHERAHAGCFIASSVSFPVKNEPLVTYAEG
jgi:organic hydroperoxide reductase OsmC/OhrA